ncbi:unnamed protein product [Cyclocybe aegerita]|uniref:Uncharacterized protein n=1 Tax=Cyclocybe aegerita TaxID=1973307 RepID=A0A8S0W1Q6_CYCAE|nr:unnamed protein product [Cyclocybe aegerita]
MPPLLKSPFALAPGPAVLSGSYAKPPALPSLAGRSRSKPINDRHNTATSTGPFKPVVMLLTEWPTISVKITQHDLPSTFQLMSTSTASAVMSEPSPVPQGIKPFIPTSPPSQFPPSIG